MGLVPGPTSNDNNDGKIACNNDDNDDMIRQEENEPRSLVAPRGPADFETVTIFFSIVFMICLLLFCP